MGSKGLFIGKKIDKAQIRLWGTLSGARKNRAPTVAMWQASGAPEAPDLTLHGEPRRTRKEGGRKSTTWRRVSPRALATPPARAYHRLPRQPPACAAPQPRETHVALAANPRLARVPRDGSRLPVHAPWAMDRPTDKMSTVSPNSQI